MKALSPYSISALPSPEGDWGTSFQSIFYTCTSTYAHVHIHKRINIVLCKNVILHCLAAPSLPTNNVSWTPCNVSTFRIPSFFFNTCLVFHIPYKTLIYWWILRFFQCVVVTSCWHEYPCAKFEGLFLEDQGLSVELIGHRSSTFKIFGGSTKWPWNNIFPLWTPSNRMLRVIDSPNPWQYWICSIFSMSAMWWAQMVIFLKLCFS